MWHEDGLHRVVAGREVRIDAAPGGVRVEPATSRTPWRRSRGCSGSLSTRLLSRLGCSRSDPGPDHEGAPRLSADAEPAPVRGARRRDHDPADLAPCRRGDPRTLRPALRREARGRLGVSGTRSRRTRRPAGLSRTRVLAEESRVRGRARALGARLRRARSPSRRRGHRHADGAPGLGRWTADWFLARHLARPHAWPAGDLGVRKAVSAFYADGRPLTIPEVRTMGDRFAPSRTCPRSSCSRARGWPDEQRSPSGSRSRGKPCLPRLSAIGVAQRTPILRVVRAPFFSRTWGTSRFPTPLPLHRPTEVGL